MPGLHVREAVLDGGAFAADQPVRLLLGVGEAVGAGRLAAGDGDRSIVGVSTASTMIAWVSGVTLRQRVPSCLRRPRIRPATSSMLRFDTGSRTW
jgi:hypothetical protein